MVMYRAFLLMFLLNIGAVNTVSHAAMPELLARSCGSIMEIVETPLFTLSDPVTSIRNYISNRRSQSTLKSFDREYYQTLKVIFRDHLERIPPPGIFEANVAWFEVFLEKENIGVFDFEELIKELPEKRKLELVGFFSKNPFDFGNINNNTLYKNLYHFFDLIDQSPLVPSDLIHSESSVDATNEATAKQLVIAVAARGLDHLYTSLGYRTPRLWSDTLKEFMNRPLIKAAKVAFFNAGLFTGYPLVYFPQVNFTSDEIDLYLEEGTTLLKAEAGVPELATDQSPRLNAIRNEVVRKTILNTIRKRVIELNMIFGLFLMAEKISSVHQAHQLNVNQTAVSVSNIINKNQIINNKVDADLDVEIPIIEPSKVTH